MAAYSPFTFSSEDFCGTVRLFPLPNLVLFPHVVQPLHVFEPRYCDLVAEALAGDRLIAMATLSPGWESQYEGSPPISPHACLGRVLLHHGLGNGSHNILLAGVSRIEILAELDTPKAFRNARAILLPDRYPDGDNRRVAELAEELRLAMGSLLPFVHDARQQLDDLLKREVPLGTLTDLIAYLIDVTPAEKLSLLAEEDVVCRAEILVERLSSMLCDTRPNGRGNIPFPPEPSRN